MSIITDHPAYLSIRDRVAEFDFEPGTQIAIPQLADTLRLSATPIREALIRLSNENFVDCVRGKGFFVKKPSAIYYVEQYETLFVLLVGIFDRITVHSSSDTLVEMVDRFAEVFDRYQTSGSDVTSLSCMIEKLYETLMRYSANLQLEKMFIETSKRTKYFRRIECATRESASEDVVEMRRFLTWLKDRDRKSIRTSLRATLARRKERIPKVVDLMVLELHKKFC